MSQKLSFSPFCYGWWVRFLHRKKIAMGSLVCRFGEEIRKCVGSVIVAHLILPPQPCTVPQQGVLAEADSCMLKRFYPGSGVLSIWPQGGMSCSLQLFGGRVLTAVWCSPDLYGVSSHLKETIVGRPRFLYIESSKQVWVWSVLQIKGMQDS